MNKSSTNEVAALKILLLDDNEDALKVIETFLTTLGHTVAPFTDGREALLWLHDVKPQLIVADLDMPDINGFDFVKLVRAHSAYTRVPIICITGTAATDEQIAAGGFAATVRKPATLSDLMIAIDAVATGTEPQSSAPPVTSQPDPLDL